MSAASRAVRLIVFSSGPGKLQASLGSSSLGTFTLRAGNNDVRFRLPASAVKALRKTASARAEPPSLRLTSLSTEGARGATVVAQADRRHPAKKPTPLGAPMTSASSRSSSSASRVAGARRLPRPPTRAGRGADRSQAVPAPRRRAASRSFSRTPAFAWNPVKGAQRYEFQLSTSASFRESGVIFSDTSLTSPVASPALTLPVDQRLPARALRPRPRRARRHDDALERGVRLRHGARSRSEPAPVVSGPPPLDAGRRRRRLPGLVRRSAEDGDDADERRRPARVLLLPPGRLLAGSGALADPRAAGRLQQPRERLAGSGVRPLEPGLQLGEPALRRRPAEADRNGLRRRHLPAPRPRPRTG